MFAHFILLTSLHLIVSYTVMPNDYYCTNTAYRDCHNLQYYLQNNITTNTQLFFLPGVYYLYADFIIENVDNISLIGTDSNTSTIIQCNSSVGITMKNITNLTIQNMVIKNCQAQYFSSLAPAAVSIIECSAIKLHYLQIYHTHQQWPKYGISLLGFNIMSNSYFNHITCDSSLYFLYNETNAIINSHNIFLDHYNAMGNFTGHSQYAIYVELNQFSYSLTFQISNVNLKKFQNLFLYVQANCTDKCNTIIITNCQFNDYHYEIGLPLIYFTDVNVYFNNCQFVNHYCERIIVILGGETVVISYCIFHHNNISKLIYASHSSNIAIEHCKFYNNMGLIFTYTHKSPDFQCIHVVTVIIKNTSFSMNKVDDFSSLLSVMCAELLLMGPIKFHGIIYKSVFIIPIGDIKLRMLASIIAMFQSTITVYIYIEFSQNIITSLIEYNECASQLQQLPNCFVMNVAENATLIITNNIVGAYFNTWWDYRRYLVKDSLYMPCFFQYLSSNTDNNKTRFMNYSIIFNRNMISYSSYFILVLKSNKYANDIIMIDQPPFIHCYWLPDSAFSTTIPLDVNTKYVKFTNNSEWLPQIKSEKLLCYCTNDTHYDCYKDDLGYLYPGQTLAVSFCYPLADKYVDNGEVVVDNNPNQTHVAPCITDRVNETIQLTSKICTRLYYTITFITDSWCELLLKVQFNEHMEYSIFYVQQLPCPLGFIKKDGVCQCYPSFKLFGITDCDINKQAVLRPANSWIYALNHDSYIMSAQCPFRYCKNDPFYLNLSTPEVQCWFNRSGLLCGQCQHGLSAVLGFSHCQHCSNTYLLLIIPIAIAGIVLVLLLFLLNLTVTDGTINVFILYANILSVNSTIFFAYHNSHQSTIAYVFISLANLDLGIKTCFYNGMDDFAKMWLQLGFPFYLIFMATLLIIASRYSTIIQTITSHRALPVLATLFLLSYTKILRTVCNVLFLYSSITHLPSKHTTLVWSVDANVPLFGVQFTLLFVVCLILFLILVPFNVTLLFTRTLSRFNFINKFKPILDAYQGPYKTKFYYWTGLQLVIRTIFFGLSSLSSNINLSVSIIILSIINVVHTSSKPFKNKFKNYQEFLLIINLLVLYTFALSSASSGINTIAVNIMITLAVVQFGLVVIYHILTYACSGVITKRLLTIYHDVLTGWIPRFYKKTQVRQFELHHCNIPEVTYNYHEYQEPLIGQEYCQ